MEGPRWRLPETLTLAVKLPMSPCRGRNSAGYPSQSPRVPTHSFSENSRTGPQVTDSWQPGHECAIFPRCEFFSP